MLTSGEEEKNGISLGTINFAVRRGKLEVYAPKSPEVFWKLAPPGGYKEFIVVRFV